MAKLSQVKLIPVQILKINYNEYTKSELLYSEQLTLPYGYSAFPLPLNQPGLGLCFESGCELRKYQSLMFD